MGVLKGAFNKDRHVVFAECEQTHIDFAAHVYAARKRRAVGGHAVGENIKDFEEPAVVNLDGKLFDKALADRSRGFGQAELLKARRRSVFDRIGVGDYLLVAQDIALLGYAELGFDRKRGRIGEHVVFEANVIGHQLDRNKVDGLLVDALAVDDLTERKDIVELCGLSGLDVAEVKQPQIKLAVYHKLAGDRLAVGNRRPRLV